MEAVQLLQCSFVLLDRVTVKGEQRLWTQGVRDWNDFLQAAKIVGFGAKRKGYYAFKLLEARRALDSGNVSYFTRVLPKREHWRLFPLLKERVLYVDIETAERYGDITVLGAWDGEEYYSFVKGCNLDRELVKEFFSRYDLFVTFNGASFDVPIIERYFGGVLPQGAVHVDVRHVLARLGLRGGLKRIERVLGLQREGELDGMSGADAGLLWFAHVFDDDDEAMQLLLDYNRADCEHLQPLTEWAVAELWRRLREGESV